MKYPTTAKIWQVQIVWTKYIMMRSKAKDFPIPANQHPHTTLGVALPRPTRRALMPSSAAFPAKKKDSEKKNALGLKWEDIATPTQMPSTHAKRFAQTAT